MYFVVSDQRSCQKFWLQSRLTLNFILLMRIWFTVNWKKKKTFRHFITSTCLFLVSEQGGFEFFFQINFLPFERCDFNLECFLRASFIRCYGHSSVNSFPNALFLYPLKTSEHCKVFWCFQGVEKGCIACGNCMWIIFEYLRHQNQHQQI